MSIAESNLRPPPLVLYNTMTKAKEAFTPRPDQGNHVSMYVCGVTVYDYSHIGHARVYVAFDVLYRFLRALQYDVTYVRNFTDIDDKTKMILNILMNQNKKLVEEIKQIKEEKKEI